MSNLPEEDLRGVSVASTISRRVARLFSPSRRLPDEAVRVRTARGAGGLDDRAREGVERRVLSSDDVIDLVRRMLTS